ncbi:MAG: phosphotransferase family protein [Bacillota bacterium]|nr:phosphotransferase family protein [Bacillota bacterium]
MLEGYVSRASGGRSAVSAFKRASDGWETEILMFTVEPFIPEFGGLRHLAARVYPWLWQTERVRAEFLLLDTLFKAGYPVPRAVRFEPDAAFLGGPFFVMEQIRGSLLGVQYTRGTEQQKHEAPLIFGDLLARLHAMDPGAFVGEGTAWRDRHAALTTLEPESIREFLAPSSISPQLAPILKWMDDHRPGLEGGETCLLHGDFHLWNIMLREDGRPVVLDWGQAGLGDPHHDIAQSMLLSKTQNMPGVAQACLEAYGAASGRRFENLELFETMALARRLGGVMVCLADGPEALGLRPELAPYMFKRLDQIDALRVLLERQARISLPGIRSLLSQWAAAGSMG